MTELQLNRPRPYCAQQKQDNTHCAAHRTAPRRSQRSDTDAGGLLWQTPQPCSCDQTHL